MNRKIWKIITLVLFAAGLVLCIAALCGHEPAYSAAACCFFAAMAGMTAMNNNQTK